jgi:endothelin-converting enzyme
MKAAYNACMNVDLLERVGAAPLMRVLNQIASNFPVQPWVFANVAQSPHTRDAILDLSRFGATALVVVQAEADSRNPDVVAVTIAAPYLVGLPANKHYLDKALVEKYRKTVSNVLSALFPQNGHDDANGIIEFEKKLAAISPRREDGSNITVSTCSL